MMLKVNTVTQFDNKCLELYWHLFTQFSIYYMPIEQVTGILTLKLCNKSMIANNGCCTVR